MPRACHSRGRQRQGRGSARRVGNRLAEGRQRLRHPDEAEIVPLPRERHWCRADTEAEHECLPAAIDHARARERERRSDRGMPGGRQLVARREDPHAHVGALTLGRQHERRLRKVHLLGHRLHRGGGESASVQHHGELVAAEEMVGEHVVMKVAV